MLGFLLRPVCLAGFLHLFASGVVEWLLACCGGLVLDSGLPYLDVLYRAVSSVLACGVSRVHPLYKDSQPPHAYVNPTRQAVLVGEI